MAISIHKPIDEKFKETILYILSKCAFKILSIPDGKEGNIESGLLMPLLK